MIARLRVGCGTAICWPLLATAVVGAPVAPPPVSGIPGAVLVLESTPGTPGSDPAGAPPRFVLLKDGQVFVGGTARLETGRLERPEAQALRRRADAARRAAGRGGRVSFGGDAQRTLRLRFPEDEPVEVSISGDPSQATPAQQPLATLLTELLRFDHPTLVPYAPSSYALAVREGKLVGGCRAWRFAFPLEQAVGASTAVSASETEGWPTGSLPASVCAGDKRYVVTLRPLLPGEQP